MPSLFLLHSSAVSRLLAILCLGLAWHATPTLRAEEKLGPEMLVNGHFKDGKPPWKLETLEGSKADFSTDGAAFQGQPAAVVSIGNAGTDAKLWAVQLYQAEIALRKDGKYRLTFQAKSNPAKWMFVALAEMTAPYGLLCKGVQVELSDEWKQFSYDLVATKDSDDARLLFTNLNFPGAERSIAEVSLREIK